MESNCIKEINIINHNSKGIDDFIRYEREAAIHDLITENSFMIRNSDHFGPFIMNISLIDGMLGINLTDLKKQKNYKINKSISGLKKIIQTYHLACSDYYNYIKSGSTEKLEDAERLRRKIHNDGAKNLNLILENDFEIDLNTSRRLFTLLYSLFI